MSKKTTLLDKRLFRRWNIHLLIEAQYFIPSVFELVKQEKEMANTQSP